MQNNNNASKAQIYIKIKANAEVKKKKKRKETPDTTVAIINTGQKVNVCVMAWHKEQVKKIKVAFSKHFQKFKKTVGQNTRIKVPDIDKAKMYPKSILIIITVIKDIQFYVLNTKLGKWKVSFTRNLFMFWKIKKQKHYRNRHRGSKCT